MLVLLIFFDLEIRHRFNSNLQTEPSHVFTRPRLVTVNEFLTQVELFELLEQLGYRRQQNISNPGDFAASNNTTDVYVRNFDTGISSQKPQAVRFKFSENSLVSLTDHTTGQPVNQILFECKFLTV